MATRWLVIPMQKPSTPDGRGTLSDPWRAKYIKEAGLSTGNGCCYRYWTLIQVHGTDAELDALASQPDVFAVPTSGTLNQGQQNRLRVFLDKRGAMPVDTSLPVEQLVPAVIEAMLAVQRQETPAIRAQIFAELTT